jgi:hypothetical protein
VNTGTASTYTFSNVTANHTIRAAFVPVGGAVSNGSLLASYSFDGSLTDSGGNGYDLTNHNGTFAAGHNGQALTTDGSNFVQTSSGIVSGYPFTVAAWINPSQLVGTIIADDNAATGFDYWALRLYDGSFDFVTRNASAGQARSGSYGVLPSLNTWQHVTVVVDVNSQTIYLNGANPETVTGSVTFPAPNNFIVGGFNLFGSGGGEFHGAIDDLKIYSKALSAAEVQTLYSGGSVSLNQHPASQSFFGSIFDAFRGIFY